MSEELMRAGCELRLRAEGDVIGRWDRSRLEQVVANLLSNAIKYGRGGAIQVSVDRTNGTARLTVRDHGPGIPPEAQARLFERFERGSADRTLSGFGLGLWIARKVVDAHQGELKVDSQVGEGATFTMLLPFA